MDGVRIPVMLRMLGHSRPPISMRYAHLADRDFETAAEQVGQASGAIREIETVP